MSDARFGRLQRAVTLVPLALLSAAWSVSIAGAGSVGSSAATANAGGTLPDGSTCRRRPSRRRPACPTRAHLAPGVNGDPGDAVGNAAVNGIPSAALAAYQRAETVINAADTTCHLPWQLVAAIGRVESDHGRVHGSHLDEQRARPAGDLRAASRRDPGHRAHRRHRRRDCSTATNDFDRAVGPMQFIPSTWSVVGVDADGDTQRDPQDIDDAALATAVYLCSGDDDLGTDDRPAVLGLPLQPQRGVRRPGAGVLRRVRQRRVHLGAQQWTPAAHLAERGPDRRRWRRGRWRRGGGQPTAEPEPTKGPTRKPTPEPDSQADARRRPRSRRDPTQHPTPTVGPDDEPARRRPRRRRRPCPTTALPTVLPTILPTELPDDPADRPAHHILTPILTLVDAILECTLQGLIDNPLNNNDAFDQCVANLTGD